MTQTATSYRRFLFFLTGSKLEMEYRQNGTNTALSSFIDADFAGMYSVSSQDATGIVPIGAIKIAQKL